MKFAVIILLIFGFIGIAVFGFFLMGRDNYAGHGTCFAEAANGGASCPKDLLGFVTFHLDIFKKFSTAVFGNNILSVILITGLLLLIGSKIAKSNNLPLNFNSNCSKNTRSPEFLVSPLKNRFTRWLSLHENSPAIS